MEEPPKYEAHVIVIPYPSQGHINPFLQFAKRLASKGLKATLATTPYTLNSISAPNVGVEPISDGFDQGGFAQAQNEEEHSILGASFFTNSATVCAIFCHIHHGMLTLPVKIEHLPLLLPGVPPLDVWDLPSFLKAPKSYPAYLAMKLNQYVNLEKADWIFGNTFEALAVKGISELWPGRMIGPMVPSAYLDGRITGDKAYGASLWKPFIEESIEWLETKPYKSVVYISFGSMVKLTAEQMEEIAWGLKDSSFNFHWMVKESESGNLPDGFEESTKQKGRIVTWCNQLETLAQQAIADQLTDAKFIEDVWRVGVRAEEDEKGNVRREEIVLCLKKVMEGERSREIRRNASRWRELSKEAISEGASSDDCINEFAHYLTCSTLTRKRRSPKVNQVFFFGIYEGSDLEDGRIRFLWVAFPITQGIEKYKFTPERFLQTKLFQKTEQLLFETTLEQKAFSEEVSCEHNKAFECEHSKVMTCKL
ncbi:hypothetical protein LguiA_000285 [Lonicera macranthoides]